MTMHVLLLVLSFFYIGAAPLMAEDDAQTQVLYIRHVEVPGNVLHPDTYIYTGSGTDESLTEKGKIQSKECAKKILHLQKSGALGKITAIYASDLKRARETAEPISQALGLPIQVRHNLREIYWGCADGQSVQKMAEEFEALEEQVKQRYPDRNMRWDYLPVYPGAETYNALLKRTQEELKTIAQMHRGETVLIIGHGKVLKTLIADCRQP